MTTVSAVDARRNLGRLLNIVSLRHEEIVIERAGARIAKLVPCDAEGPVSTGQGKGDFRSARGLGKEVWRNVDATEHVRKEREQWQ